MATVADILSAGKGVELVSLPPTATVREALELMAKHRIGSVLLMQGEALCRAFSRGATISQAGV
jgi:CBS domain-containing protein